MNRIVRTLIWICLFLGAAPAFAVQSVRVPIESETIDLTGAVERFSAQGDRIQVSTAPGKDGIIRRIEVSALEAGVQPAWIVFALTNDSDEQFTRLIVAPHYRLVGSGVIWPDLGSTRISAITASQGGPPERIDTINADVFRLTLDPGSTVTYVAELRSVNLPQIYLWEPDAYRDNGASLTLYEGIVIGIAGLLALFLTAIFVVRRSIVFPAAAALGWAVFAYVCIDFGFWRKLFGFEDEAEAVWRAGTEATIATTLILFLFAFLNLRRWHVRFSHVTFAWALAMAAVIALSLYNPPVSAGVARVSIAAVAGVGFLLILSIGIQGSERAIMLIPGWTLLSFWAAAAGAAVQGELKSDIVAPGIIGGLVLIVLLIGFTVTQYAFSGAVRSHPSGPDFERRALAMTGSGDAVFDWNVVADHVHLGSEIETQLGLKRGVLGGSAANWLDRLHPLDKDRYSAALDGLLSQRSGRIHHDVRLKASDGQYHWYLMKARPVVSADGDVVRVVGSLADVTDLRAAEERMLHDAVHDNLTGLPNRKLFADRVETSVGFAARGATFAPVVVILDIDGFQRVNEALGVSRGDSALLTVARRLGRNLSPGDTLARLDGDRFGVVAMQEMGPDDTAAFVQQLRGLLATPVNFGDQDANLTASAGFARWTQDLQAKGADLLRDAELALANAKRAGGNCSREFNPSMRTARGERAGAGSDLKRALERGEVEPVFRPIVRLEDRTVAGFDLRLSWKHAKRGVITAAEIYAAAEEVGLGPEIGQFALDCAARELAAWQKALDVSPPIFVSVPTPASQFLRQDLLSDLKTALTRRSVQRGSLKLAVSESAASENPELAVHLFQRFIEVGAGLILDEFGAGHSSIGNLQRYRFDILRLDASLVRAKGASPRPTALRGLITLAHDHGAEVTAEGAENESDAVELAQLGCDFAQGSAFGALMSSAEARKLMGAEAV